MTTLPLTSKNNIFVQNPNNGKFWLEATFSKFECTMTEKNGDLIFKEEGEIYSLKTEGLEISKGEISAQESHVTVQGEDGKQRTFKGVSVIPLLKTFIPALKNGEEMPPIIFPRESLDQRTNDQLTASLLKGSNPSFLTPFQKAR